ncbi:MAG: hypothetical protein LBB89_03780 [Treponema sp.]|jgi:hypothetical protein|nr:hypothetical protein [Treponema sp.]
MLKTCAEISKLKHCTRQSVDEFLKKNKIAPSGKKGKLPLYDCGKEPLAGYLAAKFPPAKQKPQTPSPEQPENLPNNPPAPDNAEAVRRISKPLNDLLRGKVPEGQKPSSVFYAKAMKIAEANQDAQMLFRLGQLADKENRDEEYQRQRMNTERANESIAQEKAARLKIENDIRREQFMDRSTVKLLFGKVYAVHTSTLTPLPLKLSSMIAAVPEGNGKEATINNLINDEIYAALESIKRLLVDFVEG